jgi:lambda repressor-like predicted transcriptional regulator
MKVKFTAIALILASGLIASTSFAEVSREQVNAELAQAIRSGDMLADGETGLKLNELYPSRYPAKQVQTGLTREQVQAELAQAIRSGDMLADGETGLKLNEMYPSRYPAKQVQAGLTPGQVKAELAKALRTGDFIVIGGEFNAKCNELHPNMHPVI